VTSDLPRRVFEHKNNLLEGFTKKYKIHNLVWYEQHETILGAITREKQLKKYKRKWKMNLIDRLNPEWKDLYSGILG
jgi:putative endonuclease